MHDPSKIEPSVGWHEFCGTREYILKGNWTTAPKSKPSRIKQLLISYNESFVPNLDCLSAFPCLESLRVHSGDVNDIAGAYQLRRLKTLSLDVALKAKAIDLSHFTNLSNLSLSYPKRINNLDNLSNLKCLRMDHLSGIKHLDFSCHPKLSDLFIGPAQGVKSISLDGLRKLQRLGLVLMPRLVSIQGSGYHDRIRTLDVRGTKHLPRSFFKAFTSVKSVDVGTLGTYTLKHFPNCNPHITGFPV